MIVTPSRYVPLPPEVLMGNRVLRHFQKDNALRLVFLDDDFWKLGRPVGEGWIAGQMYAEGTGTS